MRDYYDLTEEGRRRRLRGVAMAALADYDLDVVRMRGMTDATNGVFRLDASDGRRYAMRVGLGPPAGHTVAETRSEMEWLDALAGEPDIVVPAPVRTRDGDRVTIASAPDVPHERPCAVFTWLEGSLLADRLGFVALEPYGAAMAHLHTAARRFRPSVAFNAPSFDRVYPYDVLMANDVINQPEWLHAEPEIYERGERRIRDMLGRLRSRDGPLG